MRNIDKDLAPLCFKSCYEFLFLGSPLFDQVKTEIKTVMDYLSSSEEEKSSDDIISFQDGISDGGSTHLIQDVFEKAKLKGLQAIKQLFKISNQTLFRFRILIVP